MSTNNRIRVMIGLTVMGSFGWATVRDHADADEPRGSSPASAVASAGPERYLMLTNGRIIKGVVTEETYGSTVTQAIGVMHFPKRTVEGAFDTIRDAYLYRLDQLPERDADERMKLAHWCLNLSLKAEAREQLKRVLELNSKHAQAKAMMFSMEQAAAIVAQRERDPEVKQTGGETTREDRPKALDSAVLQRAQRGLNVAGIPVIFDLPAPLAIKRYNEFCRFVHPVLQHYCARCHDGNYDGEFQIVPIKGRGDLTVEAVRANLDATLRLIDQENPSKSELLTSTLRAHGLGPRPRSIFPGSNDLTYKILATWVQSLRSPKPGGDANPLQSGRAERENGEAFASGRNQTASESPEAVMSALANSGRRPASGVSAGAQIPQPSRLAQGGDGGASGPNQAAPDEFPLPFVLTGKMPNIPAPKTPPVAAVNAPRTGAASRSAAADTASKAAKSADEARKTGEKSKAAGETGAAKKQVKPLTIDPTLLERALLNRNNPPR